MKWIYFKYYVFILLIFPQIIYCQRNITITKPRIEIFEENLIINYDILNAKPSDFYKVWIEVTDSDGKKINAISVTGDVGQEIKGGTDKRIIWNMVSDKIYIDKEIIIEVKAELSTKLVELKEKEESSKNLTNISKTNMVLTSIPIPGLGQSLLKRGKPYWLAGVAGYGCLAGSVILNRMAASTYDEYKSSDVETDRISFFDEAVRKDKYSKCLAYSAIGIWAADLIWVIVTPTKSSRSQVAQKERKLEIKPCLDTRSNITMVSLTYKF